MELESSNSNGFALVDYKEALMRWSKSWAELAEDNGTQVDSLKVEDLESDAGYVSEGSYRFYVGSKTGSFGSLEDCAFDEEEKEDFVSSSDEVCHIPEDTDDSAHDDASNDAKEPEVSIEMIGCECVLVNGYQPDDLPCPFEATRDGLTPEVNLEYNHEDLIDVACRFLAYLGGRNEQRPKIYWAMKYAPEYEDESDS